MTALRPRNHAQNGVHDQGFAVDVVINNDDDSKLHAKGDVHPSSKRPIMDLNVASSTGSRNKYIYLLTFSAAFIGMLAYLQLRGNKLQRKVSIGYPVVDHKECGSEEERVLNVFEWAVAHGAHLHYNLTTGTFPIPGSKDNKKVRGLMARGNIKDGEILFAVPPQLLLNLRMLATHPVLKPVYDAVPELHDGMRGLAVLLLYEAFNKSSAWRPYLCSLPEHVPLPIFYSPKKYERVRSEQVREGDRERFDELVEGRRDALEVHYVALMPKLFTRFPFLFSPADYTYARWAWACSVIMSRTWGRYYHDAVMTARTGENMSMVHTLVPAADMPNHRTGAFEAGQAPDGSLLLKAKGDHKNGDQVHISYGKKCDAEFLANYGFIPQDNDHLPCKATPWGLNETDGGAKIKKNVTEWRGRWRNHFARFYGQLTKAQGIAEKNKEKFAANAYNMTLQRNFSSWDFMIAS